MSGQIWQDGLWVGGRLTFKPKAFLSDLGGRWDGYGWQMPDGETARQVVAAFRFFLKYVAEWDDPKRVPMAAEIQNCYEIVTNYDDAESLIPRTVALLRKKWPDRQSVGAATQYIGRAAAERDAERNRLAEWKADQERRKREKEEEDRQLAIDHARITQGKAIWGALPEGVRSQIEARVWERSPGLPRDRRWSHIERACYLDAIEWVGGLTAPAPSVASIPGPPVVATTVPVRTEPVPSRQPDQRGGTDEFGDLMGGVLGRVLGRT